MSPTTNVIALPTRPDIPATVTPQTAESRTDAGSKLGFLNIGRLENRFYAAVALVLIAIAGLVLYHTIYALLTDLSAGREDFSRLTTSTLSGLLFAIIIMEVMRTVMAHIEGHGLDLEPFLKIGIISAVREILSVGARMSLLPAGENARGAIHISLLELGVNGVLVFGLAMSLVMVRRLAGPRKTTVDETK